jgi:hypothetical protein
MNASKHGVSWSVGGKGAWFALTNGRLRTSLSIPGADLDWYDAPTIAADMPTLADTLRRSAAIIAVLFIACVALGLVAIWL